MPSSASRLSAAAVLLSALLAVEAAPDGDDVAAATETLNLPARRPDAPGGAAFARSIGDLPLHEREARIQAEIEAGNVPAFLRRLVPVSVNQGPDTLTYQVTPDYLAVGADEDYFLVPLTPATAQAIADRLGCTLPTTRMVDQIYANASLKLSPAPIPPSPAMTTVPVFLRHNEQIAAQHGGEGLGALVAGHKKDVVITNRLAAAPGKVAIYGWHRPDGKPVQPLYTGHTEAWVDYSHGIRLVRRQVTLNGQPKTIDDVLSDPRLAPLLSDEGVMPRMRYSTDETIEELRLDRGVRVWIDRPATDPAKPTLLVLYALPNGSTIEQTFGKALAPGDDWHFDIQHIGAQTRFLRTKLPEYSLVVAYLENDLKSWPAWRKRHGDDEIPALLRAIRSRLGDPRIVLSGHSGGGSLIFGYLNCVDSIPDEVERIAFLDANYAYETARHADKLAHWLDGSPAAHLVALAYHDANALLDGKPFVSASGGTWGRSHAMLADLEKRFPLAKSEAARLVRWTGLDGRIAFFLKENPERKVLHTVQVERNGFIASLLAGTEHEGDGYSYLGPRAYANFISDEPPRPGREGGSLKR